MTKNLTESVESGHRKSVILTGANGFVAAKLGQVLVKSGFHVIAVVRDKKRCAGKLAFPAELVEWQGQAGDLGVLIPAVERAEAVIHLAGANVGQERWTAKYKEDIKKSRVDSTAVIAAAIRAASRKPSVYIQMSASGYYGDAGDSICRETSPLGNTFLASVCEGWEKASEDLPAETRRVVFRAGMVIGLSGGALEQLAKIYATGLAGVMGDGKQYLSWIHLDDLVGLIYASLSDAGYTGPINAVAPEPVTFREFHKTLCQAMQVTSGPPVPKVLVQCLLGERSAMILESQRLASTMAQSLGYKFLYPELEVCLDSQFSDQQEAGVSWLIQKIWLPVPVEKVWEFFSDERNLEKMTPSSLSFKVTGKSTAEISRGTTIDYKLKVHGVPLHWRTLILAWEVGVRFIDSQLKGPYRLWHHTHHFYSLAGGTLMVDEVQYKLPLGKLGLLCAGWFVSKDVRAIFRWRNDFAARYFGQKS